MVTDVILPCLNEAGALPWMLTRMPAGYRADRRRQRLGRRLRRGRGAARRAGRRGPAARLRRRLPRRPAGRDERPGLHHGRGRVDGPGRPAAGSRAGAGRPGRPGARRPPPGRARRLAAARPARQPGSSPARSAGHRGRPARPRPDARRPPGRPAGRWAWPTAGSATRWRWSCAPRQAGWRIAEEPVPYRPRTGKSKVTGTVGGTVKAVATCASAGRIRRMSWSTPRGRAARTGRGRGPADRHRQGARPGRVKTRLTPPFTPRQAATSRRGRAGRHPRGGGRACPRPGTCSRSTARRGLAARRVPGDRPSAAAGWTSGSPPRSRTPTPGCRSRGADRDGHPAGHPGLLASAAAPAGRRDRRRRVRPGRRRRLLAARPAPAGPVRWPGCPCPPSTPAGISSTG